jgi:hypothetical protein
MTGSEEKRVSRYRNWILITVIQFAAVGIFAVNGARASVISDIPVQLNDALLDGTSLYAAKAILTAAIMVSAGLVLAMLKMPPTGLFIVLLAVLGALTAIDWADITFLILAALIVVAMFGKTMTEWMQGKASGE